MLNEMGQRQSQLDLIARMRPGLGSPSSGTPYKTERRFLDFVVDGLSLYDAMTRPYDLASVLWIGSPLILINLTPVRRLLLLDPGDLSSGRFSLYVCAECGDLGCGGLTANIVAEDDHIIWRDFGIENN
jgi:hypothetical protein